MRIAVVGAGISGLAAAWRLQRDHEVTLFEAEPVAGGHARTVTVREGGASWPVDTGFVVFNGPNYPRFCGLLEELGVGWRESNMSFGVRDDRTGLEYRGSSLNRLFAQRRNLLRPSFHRLIRDIFRFFREARGLLQEPDDSLALGAWLERRRFSRAFVDQHILPLASALWSAPPSVVREFPARALARFLANHSMLQVRGRPVWRTVEGGSTRYVETLLARLRGRVRLSAPVRSLRREKDGVVLQAGDGPPEKFDRAVIAVHADQALRLLADAGARERDILGAFPYQENRIALHSDASVLPRARRAWASWNYRVPRRESDRVSVTYRMNSLQQLDAPFELCVTLNDSGEIDPRTVRHRAVFHHPVFTSRGLAVQRRQEELNSDGRVVFCGAYWGFGFHEDGMSSAEAACRRWEQS